MSGRTYPVEVRYRPLLREEPTGPVEVDQVTGIVEAVEELWTEASGHDEVAAHDILVFLSGEREIRDAAEALTGLRLPDTEIVPLFARLSAAEQHRIFEPHKNRHIGLGRVVPLRAFMTTIAQHAESLRAHLPELRSSLAVWSAAPSSPDRALALWFVSLTAEYVMMANAALFFAMVLPGVASGTMATLGLYVLARLMGQLLGIAASDLSFPGAALLSILLNVISVVIPRLDLMAQSSWLVYGLDPTVGFGFVLLQAAVFSFLVVCAAAVDLVRRQF